MAALPKTRQSLFDRLAAAPACPRAWNEFVATYGPPVGRWCRRHGLQEADARDVTQDVLLRFWRQAGSFRYDPSRRFRSYLGRIVVSALSRWSTSRRAERLATGSAAVQALLESVPARDDLAAAVERAFDQERLSRAMVEVEARVKPRTWAAFRMLALEHRSGQQVAETLGMSAANAYMARMNVQRMISEALRRQDGLATVG